MEMVYFSGPDYDAPGLWREEGEIPSCVDSLRLGEFMCNCGKHEVRAHVSLDPVDSQERVSRTVTIVL